MNWQVGVLEDPQSDDPTFEDRDAAIGAAVTRSCNPRDERPVGLWTGQEFGSQLVGIAYGGHLYRR